MRRTARAHYVAHNATTKIPRTFVYLDTEAHRDRSGTSEVQTFRLAVSACDRRRHDGDGYVERDWHRSTDVVDLWTWITGRCKSKARTVLVAHNLAYDLRIADAFTVLPALGWRCVFVRLDGQQSMAIWRSDACTLAMVDTMSWTPIGLEKLGALCGIRKLELPGDSEGDDVWFDRCVRDVEILADVWLRLMSWLRDDDLGNWKPTGAGQSWAAFRHRFKTHELLVHEDDDARTAERASTMTGRTEAWRHGKLKGGPFTEWDFTCSYATIGAECEVPTQLCGELRSPTLAKVLHAAQTHHVLCEVEVETDVPAIPVRTDDGICWPVGRLRSTAWNHELALALRTGSEIVVLRAWVYRRAPALRDFCRWVLDGIHERTGNPDPVVRVALKHWSRTLIGRTAAQWSRWDQVGTSSTAGVSLGPAVDVGAGETFRFLQVGHDLFRARAYKENPDAMVSIMAWIMAEARVRLWGAMVAAGLENVVYVDTDSVIVTPEGDERLAQARLSGLRVKSVYESLEVLGPRQIVPSGRLRASGIPSGARAVGPQTWEGEVWAGLSSSLSEGEQDRVRVALRRFRLRGTDNRRRHLKGQVTAPFTLGGRAVDGISLT